MEGRTSACLRGVFRWPAAIVLALSLVQGRAFAQSVTPGELDQAARRGEQLLREQQQAERERQLERDRKRQQPSGEVLPELPAIEAPDSSSNQCVEVKTLELIGARLLPAERISGFKRSVAGRCVGRAELNDLLRSITDSYVSLGYVTSRAYVPPQDTSDGKLTIVVIEGVIERVQVQPAKSANAETAFPNVVGHVLNLREIEQGIDQLNRLSTNDARLDIQPGSTPGSSVLVVLNSSRRRITGSFASDNTGSSETGEWQGTATLLADNPLDMNDGLLLSHSRSLDDPEGPAASRSTSLSYSIPYGWWTGSLTFSESAYASVIQGITRSFVTSGTSQNAALRVDRVAYRNQTIKVTMYGGLSRRDSENFVAGELIRSSSRVLSSLDFDVNVSVARGGTLWSFDAGLSRGVSWLGALDDPAGLPETAPRAQFTKLTLGAGLTRGFDLLGVRSQLSSTWSGQWSNDVLYSSEQITIAGPFSVRGYRDVRLFGDRGMTWRNELGFPFSLGSGGVQPISVRPFIGADAGRVFAHETTPTGYMTGWATGVNVARFPMSLQLSWSGAGPRSRELPSDHLFFARLAASF